MSDELVRDLYILLQPIRWKIIRVLKKARRPMYIKEIAKEVGEDWKIVAFHLAKLADAGFVEGEFRVIELAKSKGRAGKFYRLTDKVDKVLSRINELQL